MGCLKGRLEGCFITVGKGCAMDPNMSIFGKEGRKRRVAPRNLGISTHIDLCRKFLEQHGTKDLASLLKGMEAWTRAMPTASQCCH